MDVVRMRNGLGNQMFNYAFYLSLLKKGRDVRMDMSFWKKYPNYMDPYELTYVFSKIHFNKVEDGWFEEHWEEYEREIKHNSEKMRYFEEHPEERHFWGEPFDWIGCYDEKVYKTKECIFVGTWLSEKYFIGCEDLLRGQYVFPYGEKKLQQLLDKIEKKNVVVIQFRLGNNYYGATTTNKFKPVNILENGYYDRAIEFVRNETSDMEYLIISDDLQKAKKCIDLQEAIYITSDMFDNYENWYDMCIISKCKYIILANSTFGWWGAWLNERNDKLVIVPKRYGIFSEMRDIYPDPWIKL